ncbi:MAG: TonB-dependent receptor plug domain-containing protein [Flavobacteriaceae bacterium]|nr:TonB-dependent receptor plug domain-containing protein [Flavobacteriaceae bacterium]
MKSKLVVFISIVLFSFSNAIAQDDKVQMDYENTSLKEILKEIEKQLGVRFSYNEKIITGKELTVKGEMSFRDLLDLITESTKLYFNILDKENIVIQKTQPKVKTFEICGNIQDENGAISDVTIRIASKFFGTISDSLGDFKLDRVQEGDLIEIQFLGYKTIQLQASEFIGKDCPAVILEEDTTMLSEVVLTEYITTGFDRNNHDGSVTVSPDKLGILPGLTEPDVLQSLQLLPGVSSPTESASELHVRGGTPDQNLVLWDGIKMYHQGHFFGQISAFNPYITDKIDVYRSGTSARYGDRVAGVINIASADDILDKVHAGAGFNFTQTDAYIRAPLVKDKLGVTASIRRSYSDVINTITFEKLNSKVFQNTKIENGTGSATDEEFNEIDNNFYFTDANLKLNWKPNEKNQIFFSGLFVANELDYEVIGSEFRQKDDLDLINDGASFKWSHTASDKWTHTIKAYFSHYNSNYSFDETDIDDQENFSLTKDNTIADFGASIQSQHKINDVHSFFGGYDFVNNNVSYLISLTDDMNLPNIESQDDTQLSHSAFGEHEYNKNGLFIRTGLRINYFTSDHDVYFEPRVCLEKKLGDYFTVKGSGEIKNQVLSQLVLFDFNEIGVGNNIWVLANDTTIPVLNSQQFTTGILFQKNGWNIDLDGYYKKVYGLTSLSKGFNNNTNDEYSEGENDIFGVDFLIKKRIKNFRTWLSYSVSKSELRFDELQNAKFPGNFDQRHTLTFSNTLKVNEFQFSLGWTFSSGKPYSEPVGINSTIDGSGDEQSELIFNGQNNKRLGSYHRLDASAVYDFNLVKNKNIKARAGVSALNLYNRENEIDKVFKIDQNTLNSDDAQIIEQTRIGLGITPNIVFRVTF